MARVNTQQVDIRAIKKSETGNMVIVRVQELFGKDAENVEIALGGKITSAYEIDGQERKTGDAAVKDGKLVTGLTKFAIRSFALILAPPVEKMNEPEFVRLILPFDENVIASDKYKKNGAFVPRGYAIPADLFPDNLVAGGIRFSMGGKAEGQNNVLACKGQKIQLPKTGNYNRVYILAAATRDTTGIFKAGESRKTIRVQNYEGMIGQFDKRNWDKLGRLKSLDKGYIKRDDVAWFATHVRNDTLNDAYHYAYIFKYSIDASPASGFLQLPENDAIKIFAITVAENYYDQATPAQPLYDDFTGRKGFPLVLDKSYVSEEMTPGATIRNFRNRNLNDLPFKVTMKDYADMHMPNGVTVNYYFSGSEKLKTGMPEQGVAVASINDGMFDLLPSDSAKDVWFSQGEGRIVMDLQKNMGIDSLHLFSTTDTRRGPQVFSIWTSDKPNLPSVSGDPKAAGWKYLAYARPADVWGNGKIVYSILPDPKMPLNCRYIMWVSENTDYGPYYFREVDVFER
jgi:alpha-mannosidase